MESILVPPSQSLSPVNDAIRSIERRFLTSMKYNLDNKKMITRLENVLNEDDITDKFIKIDLKDLPEVVGTDKSTEIEERMLNSTLSDYSPAATCLSCETVGAITEGDSSMTTEPSSKKIRPLSVGRHIPPHHKQKSALNSRSTSPWHFRARPMPPFAEIHKRESLCHHHEFKSTKAEVFKFESDVRVLKRREYDRVAALRTSQLEGRRVMEELKKSIAVTAKIHEMRNRAVEDGGMSFKATPILLKDTFPVKTLVSSKRKMQKAQSLSLIHKDVRSMTKISND